jgi:hypothetical protein
MAMKPTETLLRPHLATEAMSSSRTRQLDYGAVLVGIAFLVAVFLLSTSPIQDGGDMRTRNTVRLSLAWYAVALFQMMRLDTADWSAATFLGRFARWCWTWAMVCFLVHLMTAFNYFHHWSHAHAFNQTRQVSGVGEGIYTLYLFVGVGLVDALWWWIRPKNYAGRSAWIDRVLHSFMLFIVFNGMIVFESGPIRWAGVLLFALLVIAWYLERGIPRRRLS